MRHRDPHNMSLSFSIDRILSPDFGPRKSVPSDTCSVISIHAADTSQGLCKNGDFSYKKLLTDTYDDLSLEMPSPHDSRSKAALLSIISGSDFGLFEAGKSKADALENGDRDILLWPRGIVNRYDLEDLNHLGTSSDCLSVKSCPDKQSQPLTKVVDFIEAEDLPCGKNFQPPSVYSEQSSSPISFITTHLPEATERSKPPNEHSFAVASPTKETSSPPRKKEKTRSPRDSPQPLTKPHQDEDLLQRDEVEIPCDTKPQVPEELFQKYMNSLTDGRCSSSPVNTLSSTVGSESNHSLATCEKLKKPDLTTAVIKESLSDDGVGSPPPSFSDSKGLQSSTPSHKLSSDDLSGKTPPPGNDWPVWVFCSRYSARPSSGPRSRRQSRKVQPSDEKRCRTAFTMIQLHKLHEAFKAKPYLCEKRRNELARDLQLSESQVKIWFQNRRAKVKKATGTKNPLADLLKEQGLYNHSTTKA